MNIDEKISIIEERIFKVYSLNELIIDALRQNEHGKIHIAKFIAPCEIIHKELKEIANLF